MGTLPRSGCDSGDGQSYKNCFIKGETGVFLSELVSCVKSSGVSQTQTILKDECNDSLTLDRVRLRN